MGLIQISKHVVSKVSFGFGFGKRNNAGHENTTVNKIAIIHIRTFIQNLFLSKKEKKNVFPCLNPSFTIMFGIRWSKLHERVFMIKRFEIIYCHRI